METSLIGAILKDLPAIVIWYSFIQILAIAAFPLTKRIFSGWSDAGWGLNKTVGIFVFGWLTWLATSLHIFRFDRLFLLIFLFLLLFISFYWGKFLINFKELLSKNTRLIAFEEFLFIFFLVGWSIIRGFFPEMRGLEKFMDYGFIVASLESAYSPPRDMWYSGSTINYYYFGHYITAVLTKLSNLPSEITYNIQIANIFSLSVVSAFSIGYQLTKKYIIGILTFVFINIIGNLHFLVNLPKGLDKYWYPDATRLIPFTISEYPMYSYVVADLHGHLSSLPLVILAIALIYQNVIHKKSLLSLLGLGVFIGGLFATNSWDYPIYLMLFGVSLFIINLWDHHNFKTSFVKSLSSFLIVFVISVAAFAPFIINFKPISTGIGVSNAHSPLDLLLIFWGFPLLMLVCFLIWFGFQKKVGRIEIFFISLILVCLILIIFPEFFFVRDIYTVNYFRANTMFKLYYQAWVMMGIFMAWSIVPVSQSLLKIKPALLGYLAVVSFFTFGTGAYAYMATKTYYQELKTYYGLDGLAYLNKEAPDDLEAIYWIRKNTRPTDVIVEGVGDSYTNYGRVSSYTGRSTVLGWPVHQWLWRGSWPIAAERQTDVARLYETTDTSEVINLARKYKVRYVYIGEQERSKYPSLAEDKFSQLGSLKFQNNTVRIYQINNL